MAKKPKPPKPEVRLDALEARASDVDIALSLLIYRADMTKEYKLEVIDFLSKWEHPITQIMEDTANE